MTVKKENIEMVKKFQTSEEKTWWQRNWKKVCASALIILLYPISIFISFTAGLAWGKHQFSDLVTTGLSGVYTNELPETAPKDVDFEPFWDAWALLDNKFVGGASTASSTEFTTTSDQDRVWGAIAGLTRSYGDPFTSFLPPEETETFEADISGEFSGVGMEIGNRDGLLTVISPLPGTPAHRAGVQPQDIVSKIDGTDSIDMSTEQAVKLIRGPKGEPVTIEVLRRGSPDPIEITIVRDTIKIPTLETGIVGDTFVIKLYSFTAKSPALFQNAIKEFAASGKTKLIFDLRGNPGGYLEAAISMSSWFLDESKVVVTEEYGKSKSSRVHMSEGYNIFNDNLRMVILTNGGSASASEIVAGALRDHKRALLVGQTTFGKGSVQELFSLTKDTSIKITIAKWLTPSGDHISENGIEPDVSLDLPEPTDEPDDPGSYNVDFSQDPEVIAAVKILQRSDFTELFDSVPDSLQEEFTASSTEK